jgi:uncharacterized protein YndB with AHSA1/START domain
MKPARTGPTGWLQYELEFAVAAPPAIVWRALLEETQAWWLPDFRMVGTDSVVTFDPRAGGRGLVEELPGGGSLLWYTVHMHQPEQHQIWLVGQIASDFGGPATSMLKLAAEPAGKSATRLVLTDALLGNVSDAMARSLRDGWTQLFDQGLRQHVETQTPS